MTRGQIAIIINGGIMTSTEFNGDMYMPDGQWAGHGQEVIDLLKEVKDVADYQFAVAKFNKENHHYNDERLTFKKAKGYETLDFVKNYFDNWFSDYVYIKNLTKNTITLNTRECDENGDNETEKKIELEPNQIAVLCFGRLELIA